MTTPIQSANPSSSISAFGAIDANAQYLTPESLLAYCAARLNAIDTLIQTRFAEQARRNDELEKAGRLLTIVNRFTHGQSKGANANGEDVGKYHKAVAADLSKLFNETKDPRLQALIRDYYRTVTGNEMPFDKQTGKATATDPEAVQLNRENIVGMSFEEWQAKASDIKTLQDSMSKDNEMTMIQLQSMISQRQLAIQLTTQMLSTAHEGKKTIVGNIRG